MLPARFGGGISNMFSPRLLLALVATVLLTLPGEKPPPALPPPKPPEKQADSKKGFQLGVYKLEHPGQPDDPAFDEIERVLRSIAEASPSVKSSLFMPRPPKGCELEDD